MGSSLMHRRTKSEYKEGLASGLNDETSASTPRRVASRPLTRLADPLLLWSFFAEHNSEVIAKRRMPIGFGCEHLLFLPAVGGDDQAHAGQGYATVRCGQR